MDEPKKPKPQGWNVKTLTYVPGVKYDPNRVDLVPADYDKLLRTKGTRVRVFLTTFCPNVKSIDGAEHNIECNFCTNGWLDVRPIETIAFIQNQALEKLPFVEGMVDGNTCAMTFPTGIELQYFTLVQLIDFSEKYFQRVKRQQGRVDVLKYQAQRVNVLIDQYGKEYFEEVDFGIDPNGSILWKDDKGPDPDTIYSIHYECAVQFRAVRAMHSNRFSQIFTSRGGGGELHVKLPEQWAMSKEFLVKRKDVDGNEILPNLIVDKQDAEEPEDPFER